VASWRYLDYDVGTGRPFTDLSLNRPRLAMAYRWQLGRTESVQGSHGTPTRRT